MKSILLLASIGSVALLAATLGQSPSPAPSATPTPDSNIVVISENVSLNTNISEGVVTMTAWIPASDLALIKSNQRPAHEDVERFLTRSVRSIIKQPQKAIGGDSKVIVAGKPSPSPAH